MRVLFAPLFFVLFAPSPSHAVSWNDANNPALFSSNYSYQLNSLPAAGGMDSENIPWSETYWPMYKGGINYRWNSPAPAGFDYESPSQIRVRNMSRNALSQLSPSEKYDLAMGHYDYPLKKEVRKETKKYAKTWHGFCNGWASAALIFSEPQPIDVVNPDGITIPFGASDVKGLLTFRMAMDKGIYVAQVGQRCRGGLRKVLGTQCGDTNPGALHVILANELGIKKTGFIMDVDNEKEVWNQPVYAFESTIVGSVPVPEDAAEQAASAVLVQTKITYTNELPKSQWEPVVGTDKFRSAAMDLKYILELDHGGNIVGGEWISDSYPDFLWKVTQYPAEFSGKYEGLAKIYKPKTKTE